MLPILPYRSLDEAIAFVAAGERPLALYCFSNSRRERERVLDGAISGGVTLNGTLMHVAQENLPFGGVGAAASAPITATKASSASAMPGRCTGSASSTSSSGSARPGGSWRGRWESGWRRGGEALQKVLQRPSLFYLCS